MNRNRRDVQKLEEYLVALDHAGDEDPPVAESSLEERLRLRQRLAGGRMPAPSAGTRDRVRNTLLTAAVQRSERRHPMFEHFVGRILTRATAFGVAGLVLAGTAVGASAAFGGPNLPGQALHAIGFTTHRPPDQSNGQGIKNAPTAAATGESHANSHAFNGSDNATVATPNIPGGTPPPQSTGGINNAPSAASNGKAHANEHAFNGSGNASSVGPGVTTPSVTTPSSPPTPGPNATEGAGNASEGIGNAPVSASNGENHAAPQASEGSGNAPTVIPTPPQGSSLR